MLPGPPKPSTPNLPQKIHGSPQRPMLKGRINLSATPRVQFRFGILCLRALCGTRASGGPCVTHMAKRKSASNQSVLAKAR